ncbi:MAG: endoribonuclease ysh1 [Alyxoria varia]|nr:MAG: endoribonuclease ysh1 [Alyxoria varia]
MSHKRKHSALAQEEEPVDESDKLLFNCLGGGNEVGRSCHIIQFRGKTVMLDAGMHPAYDGQAALPFFDEFDLSTVDVLLISHFHIDHAAALPYVLSKTNFRGRVFMTYPTKAIYKSIIQDSVRVGNVASSSEQRVQLYNEADHLETFPQIQAIDFYTTHTVSSIRITPYPAGHVLGAAMFLIEIAGVKILFTGDYSREYDRHLIPAEVPKGIRIDVLITESTYGVASHVPRLERETALMKSITGIIDRGGRALLPVFALGRAQELMLMFDEYWARHPEYQNTPIYYASNLAKKCLIVYQTYIGSMNDNIKRMFKERMAEAEAGKGHVRGAWDFQFIRSLKSLDRFDDVGSCVMLASPGMMQNGVSRELLERWAPDDRNGVVITGYSVEGTMARTIMQEPEQIQAIMRGSGGGGRRGGPGGRDEQVMLPRRCSVQEFSFAAHVDGQENKEFIEEINAPVVILVHGEQRNMTRLKSKLLSLNTNKPQNQKTKIYSPANCSELHIPLRTEKTAKIVGKLADRLKIPTPLTHPPSLDEKDMLMTDSEEKTTAATQANGTTATTASSSGIDEPQIITNAVLVQNDLKYSLMLPEDLREFAGLNTTMITCRHKMTLASASLELIRWALEGVFGGVEILSVDVEKSEGNAAGRLENETPTPPKAGIEYEPADEEIDRSEVRLRVMDTIVIIYRNRGEMEIEWEANMMNDTLADTVIGVLLEVESSPASVKQSSKLHSHGHSHSHSYDDSRPISRTSKSNGTKTPPNGASDTSPTSTSSVPKNPFAAPDPATRLSRLLMLLESQFGADCIDPVTTPPPPPPGTGAQQQQQPTPGPSPPEDQDQKQPEEPQQDGKSGGDDEPEMPDPVLRIHVDHHVATVRLQDLSVDCGSSAVIRQRVEAVVNRAMDCIAPVWQPKGGVPQQVMGMDGK